MHFSLTLAAALLSLLPVALAVTVTSPNTNAYWVYGQSNTISWTYSSGDPQAISIFITNSDSSALNGPFAVAENVPISQQLVTVTQVTLRPDDGYIVNFVDAKNDTNVFAQSSGFTVKPQGSLPYGETVIVTSSFSVSGSLTLAWPITETSISGQTFATGFVTTPASGSSTSAAPAGPATAQVVHHTNSAASGNFVGAVQAMTAVIGLLVGGAALL